VARSLDDYLAGRYQLTPVEGQTAGIGKQPSEQTVGRADPLEALAACGELRADLVREALEAGATWEDVGESVGISRHAGWARFQEEQQRQHWARCWAVPGPVGVPQSDVVRQALEAGATWEEVGEAIGISRQAGWAQFWEGVQHRHLAECWAIPGPVRSAPE
jgi:hypothetical protein